ncbi:MAG: M23 family metallopeptidase [Thermoleophilia bacterium]
MSKVRRLNPISRKRASGIAFGVFILLPMIFSSIGSAASQSALSPQEISLSDPNSRESFERNLSPGNYRGSGNILGLETPYGPGASAGPLDFSTPGSEADADPSRPGIQIPTLPQINNPTPFYMQTGAHWPLGSVPLSSGFDYPVGGLNHEGFDMINCFGCGVDWLGDYGHTAEDYANGREGDAVYSISEGIVLWRGVGPNAYGNVLIVQHKVQGTFIYSLYAHLQTINVVPGQVVGRRQQIATVGSSGSFLPHLHFEVRTQPHIAARGYTFYPFTGASINAYDMTFYAPSWYINNRRHLDNPFGAIDGAEIVPGGFKVSGWALDPNTPSPVIVHAYRDGQGAAIAIADHIRWDVGINFPSSGTQHGFSASIPAGPGLHNACVYAINAGPGANGFLGCYLYNLSTRPIGSLDGVSREIDGQLRATGWALDPDTASPIDVHFYINGQFAGSAGAAESRIDVAGRFPEFGDRHGFAAYLPRLAGTNIVCAYGINVGTGGNALLGCQALLLDLGEFPSMTPPAGRHYYWTYFDGLGGSDWLLLANPAGGPAPLDFDLNIQGRGINLGLQGNPPVPPAQTLISGFSGIAGGPVVATSLTNNEALVSQRILWAGKSLEEVPGIEAADLSDNYYWTWYDQSSSGYADWVMLANPGAQSIYYEITIAGVDPGAGSTGTIAAGGLATAAFPGIIGGPVEVRAWTGPDKVTPAQLMASQRVLSSGNVAFNEEPGISATELSDHYVWTWYDSVGTAGRDWLMLANTKAETVYYEITIGGEDPGPESKGIIEPGRSAYPKFSGKTGGPVEVRAWISGADRNGDQLRYVPADIVASQRSIWGPSFEEVPGWPFEALASDYHWTWYDQASPGALNWVMLSNPTNVPVYYEITVGGASPDAGSAGILSPGGTAFPSFPARIGGPVEVKGWQTNPDGSPNRSQPAVFLASQRVLWNGFFNEMTGTVLGAG